MTMDRDALTTMLSGGKKLLKLDLSKIDMQAPAPVDFSGAQIEACTLSDLDLHGLRFVKARVKDNWTNGVDLSAADFSGAKLSGDMIGVNLAGAIFRGAKLKKMELSDCDLRGADFTGADCERADFSSSDLRDAVFRGARLTRASFDGADLRGADFSGAIDYEAEEDSESTVYEEVTSMGGPLLAIPAALAPAWTTGDYGRACEPEGKVTVAGWVTTGSVAVGGGRALVLDGEMSTGVVAIDGGVVLVRGGDFEELADASAAVEAAIAENEWRRLPHDLVVEGGALWIFDSAVAGAADRAQIAAEDGTLEAVLGDGAYQVEVSARKGNEEPLVFIRLRAR